MSTFILGVDGGQTSTRLLVATTDGQVLWRAQAPTASHSGEAGDLSGYERRLADILRQALAGSPWEGVRFAIVAMGMTGGEPGSPTIPACRRAAEDAVRADRYVVVHDAVTGLLGASAGRPGIVVIAGGGSVAHGVAEDGRSATAGGWGYIVGDEGSSWTVGRAAINAAFRAIDGRGPATRLVERLYRHFGVAAPIELKTVVMRGRAGFAEVAALPSLVADVAAEGDAVARSILEQAGQDLAELAEAVARRLGLAAGPVHVYPTGGLFQEERFLRPAFTRAVHNRLPQALVTPPMFDQVVGTVFLALGELGRTVDEALIERLRETWQRNQV